MCVGMGWVYHPFQPFPAPCGSKRHHQKECILLRIVLTNVVPLSNSTAVLCEKSLRHEYTWLCVDKRTNTCHVHERTSSLVRKPPNPSQTKNAVCRPDSQEKRFSPSNPKRKSRLHSTHIVSKKKAQVLTPTPLSSKARSKQHSRSSPSPQRPHARPPHPQIRCFPASSQ